MVAGRRPETKSPWGHIRKNCRFSCQTTGKFYITEAMKFLLICAAGAVGTGARYLISGWALTLCGTAFPYSTLMVNVVGSFLIGMIMHLGLTTELLSPITRIVLTTGFMGGFTTYSSFNYETMQYLQEGEIFKGTLNILVMILSCLSAGVIGLILARRLLGS